MTTAHTMTTANMRLAPDIDYLVDRPLPGLLTFSRVAAGIRSYLEARRRIQSLRHLSDRMLLDIGVDPESVRSGDFPRIAPDANWLWGLHSLRQ